MPAEADGPRISVPVIRTDWIDVSFWRPPRASMFFETTCSTVSAHGAGAVAKSAAARTIPGFIRSSSPRGSALGDPPMLDFSTNRTCSDLKGSGE